MTEMLQSEFVDILKSAIFNVDRKAIIINVDVISSENNSCLCNKKSAFESTV